MFHENEDIAWIAKIDKRYAWLKRHLLDFEERLGKIFLVDWEISERITVQFCHQTREALAALMQRRRTEIDVKLLLFAISKTQQFEMLLAKRFNGSTFTNTASERKRTRIIASAVSGGDNINPAAGDSEASLQTSSPFIGLISSCFEAFLDIYTDSVDRNLAELMERFVQESNAKVAFDPIINNSTVFPRFVCNFTYNNMVLSSLYYRFGFCDFSCADLFVFYKKCLVQCTQLSTERPMYQLSQIFKKYLREYASKILDNKIPKPGAQQTSLGRLRSSLTTL